jgi:hypothetical protein
LKQDDKYKATKNALGNCEEGTSQNKNAVSSCIASMIGEGSISSGQQKRHPAAQTEPNFLN